jgi:3-oxoacyl-[acyl-carrier-protein] synthase-3
MKKSKIAGIGFNVPNNVVTNHDLEDMMDTTDEWIKTRSGIEERRWVEPGTANSDLALPACIEAIQKAGITPNEIDIIIVGTVSSDYNFPGMAPIIQQKLGIANHVPAYDISAACSAFIYLLEMGDQYIKSGKYKNVLLVGSDLMSTIIDRSPEGRATGVLFGDGSGAVVLQESQDDSQILSTHLFADGKGVEHLVAKAPGSIFNPLRIDKKIVADRDHLPYQNGREVFKNAVTRMPEAINVALEHNHLNIEDVSLVIAHQANKRILETCAKRMNLPMEKMFVNIHKYGNTTAATIPIAICEALEENKFSKGDYIILTAFGAGYTWASAAIKW